MNIKYLMLSKTVLEQTDNCFVISEAHLCVNLENMHCILSFNFKDLLNDGQVIKPFFYCRLNFT